MNITSRLVGQVSGVQLAACQSSLPAAMKCGTTQGLDCDWLVAIFAYQNESETLGKTYQIIYVNDGELDRHQSIAQVGNFDALPTFEQASSRCRSLSHVTTAGLGHPGRH